MAGRKGNTQVQNAMVSPGEVASSDALFEVYRRLYAHYGPQHWWPGESRLEIILGAILTQAVAWTGVERALANLKTADLLSTQALRDVPEDALAAMLKPSGYFNAKARKVKAFINHLWGSYGGDLESLLSKEAGELREELLSIHGIGEETADDILLYAAEKPSFVIDTYTRRIFKRLALSPDGESYREYQAVFQRGLPPDPSLYNEYHALLDRHAKEACRKEPRCVGCCLLELCPTGKDLIDMATAGNL